jgi:hypothetical protein
MEIFEDINGYEGHYQINRLGQVRNILKERGRVVGKILKPCVCGAGYFVVTLCKNGFKTKYYIHRLIGIQFIPNPENKSTIDHIDRNRTNNNFQNIRWATQSEQNHNTCRNVTPEQARLNKINLKKKINRWLSIKTEFLRILR